MLSTVVLDPIFDFAGDAIRIHAFDCSCHDGDGPSAALDQHCFHLAFDEASGFPSSTQMNIAVHAATLLDDADLVFFIRCSASAHDIDLQSIVVEIIDEVPRAQSALLRRRISELRNAGLRVSCRIESLGELSVIDDGPDFLKIGRGLIEGVDEDPSRSSTLQLVASMARSAGARVVAEGVQTWHQVWALRNIGIDLMQGCALAARRVRTA